MLKLHGVQMKYLTLTSLSPPCSLDQRGYLVLMEDRYGQLRGLLLLLVEVV